MLYFQRQSVEKKVQVKPFDHAILMKVIVIVHICQKQQEGQRCPKRQVAQAAIRLATAVITFRNKERNVRLPQLR